MPAEFRKLGISFQYPENWTLDEEDARAGRKSVTVFSPGTAFWSVSIHPPGTESTQLAKAALDAMKEDYADLEAEAAIQALAGCEMVGYDMHFWYLDLTNTAAVRCFSNDRATYAVFFQAEDREFDQSRPVFEAITTSFLRGLPG
jgi:hypothetical protein